MPGTRKLGRDTAHRTAMLRGLVTFFFENGKIETTVTRAKEVRSMAEKMITIAKVDNLHNRRMVLSFVTKEAVTNKLFTEIAPQYVERNGGYTRVTKIGPRRGDAAEMAILELV
jgi:ribosomal protein L17